jgi:hypothetical protein
VESNTYQDRITTIQNELNHERTHTEALQTVAIAAGIALRQQPHIQLASIPDLERFNSSRDKLQSFVCYLHLKLADNACRFSNLQHQLQYTFRLLVGQGLCQGRGLYYRRRHQPDRSSSIDYSLGNNI